MSTLDQLLAHDAWTTQRLLEACGDLDNERLDRVFDMGPGTVRSTFIHIIGTMEHWADRIAERIRTQPAPDPSATIDDLKRRLEAAAAALRTVAEDVRSSGRGREMMEVTYEGTCYRFTRGIALVHVATHGMHHRAQIINMLRRLGVDHGIEGDAIEWELAGEPMVGAE
ncbi:MAG: DinB family protein [Phycisphaerales bacterium]|nr:DinB family protein [Phycisphaerae bacterium]NNF43885.1 DinB family protein [Phycisphaerales bacterium]NNM24847.1 DinB family protein [Phycisphaerales bacterium]